MNIREIKRLCNIFSLDYTINTDGSVDINGDADLSNAQLKKLPLKFGKITGNFYCGENEIKNLENSPYHVSGNFICSFNNLTTLKGIENCTIDGDFKCVQSHDTIPVFEYRWILYTTVFGVIKTGLYDLDEFLNENKNSPKRELIKVVDKLKKIKL